MAVVADYQPRKLALLVDDGLEQCGFESQGPLFGSNDGVAPDRQAELVLLLQLLDQLLRVLQMLPLRPSPLHFNFPPPRRRLAAQVLGDGAHGGLQRQFLRLDDQLPLLFLLVLLLLEHEASLRRFQR